MNSRMVDFIKLVRWQCRNCSAIVSCCKSRIGLGGGLWEAVSSLGRHVTWSKSLFCAHPTWSPTWLSSYGRKEGTISRYIYMKLFIFLIHDATRMIQRDPFMALISDLKWGGFSRFQKHQGSSLCVCVGTALIKGRLDSLRLSLIIDYF